MFPGSTFDYVRDIFSCYTMESSEFGKRNASSFVSLAYLKHLLGCELGLTGLITAQYPGRKLTVCMLNVLALCNPFKIAQSVVGLIAVLVVGNRAIWPWAYKRLKHHHMNESGMTQAINRERSSDITAPRRLWAQNISPRESRPIFQCSDSSVITYLIQAFKSNHLLPCLFHLASRIANAIGFLYCHAQSPYGVLLSI